MRNILYLTAINLFYNKCQAICYFYLNASKCTWKKSYFEFLTMQSFTKKKPPKLCSFKGVSTATFHFSFRKKTTKKPVFKITSQLFFSKVHLKCPLGTEKRVYAPSPINFITSHKIDTKFCHSLWQNEPTKCIYNLIKNINIF